MTGKRSVIAPGVDGRWTLGGGIELLCQFSARLRIQRNQGISKGFDDRIKGHDRSLALDICIVVLPRTDKGIWKSVVTLDQSLDTSTCTIELSNRMSAVHLWV